MHKVFLFSFFLLIAFSCKKTPGDFIWEKSFGRGNAYYVSSSPDSGVVACGELNGKPYLIKLSKTKDRVTDFTSSRNGLFNSAWYDTSGYILSGSSNGNMLLARIRNNGSKAWDIVFSAGFHIDFSTLSYCGSGSFLAVGTANPDSIGYGSTGLLFVRFDTTGNIIVKKENTESAFISAGGAEVDASGNIYLSLTRKNTGAKSAAGIAKYNSDFVKLWETELYNNPNFNSLCKGIISDNAGNLYATGETEVTGTIGTLYNSFTASINSSGDLLWKKYLEDSNSGSALVINGSDILMVLNRNCFIVDLISNYKSPDNVKIDGLIRMFSFCDSYNTEAFGSGFDVDTDGNIISAGSNSGNFYLALKPASQ